MQKYLEIREEKQEQWNSTCTAWIFFSFTRIFLYTVKVEMFTGWIFSRVKTSRTHNFAEKNQREDKNQFEYAKILPSQRNGLAI